MQNENKTAFNKSFGSDAGAWYATATQYSHLNANGAGQSLMTNSLNNLWQDTNHQDIQNKSEAIFGQTNFHFNEDLTLTTGFRITNENRINPNSAYTINQGSGADLNPYTLTVLGKSVPLGGFQSSSTGALLTTNETAAQQAAQLVVANRVAQQYFGVNYSALTNPQLQQIADAKAVRLSQYSAIFPTQTPVYNGILPNWTISPSYKFTENYTGYVSWQHGMKAGIAQSLNGYNSIAAPETDDSYEIGLKSSLFERKLILNVDLYWANIKNYQTSVQTFNPYIVANNALTNQTTAPYSAITGNVPLARTAGLELDGTYSGLPYTQIRFSGAYTDAIYVQYNNAPNPAEVQNVTTIGAAGYNASGWNASGQTLPGASKFSANISPEVRIPSEVIGLGDYLPKTEFHSSFTESYLSRYNSDASLSNYAWIPYQFNTDFSFGVGRRDKKFDVSFVAKNLLNNHTPTLATMYSYTPAYPQWIGLQLSGKF
jgi:hypothetical protein